MASGVQWIAVCQALLSLVEVELVYVVGILSCELTGLLHTGGLVAGRSGAQAEDCCY